MPGADQPVPLRAGPELGIAKNMDLPGFPAEHPHGRRLRLPGRSASPTTLRAILSRGTCSDRAGHEDRVLQPADVTPDPRTEAPDRSGSYPPPAALQSVAGARCSS